eukprot:scaffold4365_cov70-Phaeocystis_antarctica.AAC.10
MIVLIIALSIASLRFQDGCDFCPARLFVFAQEAERVDHLTIAEVQRFDPLTITEERRAPQFPPPGHCGLQGALGRQEFGIAAAQHVVPVAVYLE